MDKDDITTVYHVCIYNNSRESNVVEGVVVAMVHICKVQPRNEAVGVRLAQNRMANHTIFPFSKLINVRFCYFDNFMKLTVLGFVMIIGLFIRNPYMGVFTDNLNRWYCHLSSEICATEYRLIQKDLASSLSKGWESLYYSIHCCTLIFTRARKSQ